MEDSIALDSSKQKQFVKSIKGIKKLIKKNDGAGEVVSEKVKGGKIRKTKRKERGLVYLSHIPHGFYEHQMTQYFKQFGVVTNARVIRSPHTGNSKGHAFVEFLEPAVGQIVAETMNNYLMGKRLIKASYIPPDKQRRYALRKNWSSTYNPGQQSKLKMKKEHNSEKDEAGELKKARQLLSNINRTKRKLSELGISYDFTPVDVPQAILQQVEVKTEKDDSKEKIVDKKLKPKKKGKTAVNDGKDNKSQVTVKKIEQNQIDTKTKTGKTVQKEDKIKLQGNVMQSKGKNSNKVTEETDNSKKAKQLQEKQQKQTQKKLKEANVKPLEDYVKISPESDDDSTYDFDSDEYEKMIENEEGLSDDSEDEEGDDSVDESDEDDAADAESEEESPIKKKGKGKPPKVQLVQTKKLPVQGKKQANKQEVKQPQQMKRSAPQKAAPVLPKKPKFEKKNNNSRNKQFKKKK